MKHGLIIYLGILLAFSSITSCDKLGNNDQFKTQDNGDHYALDYGEEPSGSADFSIRQKWHKTNLTYFIESYTTDIPEDEQDDIFERALNAWAEYAPLSFSRVYSAGSADIVIGFGNGAHCELYASVGEGCPNKDMNPPGKNVLAHAYFPQQNVISGDAHFDTDDPWGNGPSLNNVDLYFVAVHEFGHSLGIDHSQDPNAIMYPSYSKAEAVLASDDIAAIQELYGSKDGTKPPEPVNPPDQNPNITPCANNQASQTDPDADGLTSDYERYVLGTNPEDCDTDGDGLSDYEAVYGLNPLNPDTDGDGVNDGEELQNGTNPYIPDQGGSGNNAQALGYYEGRDHFGNPLALRIHPNGNVNGQLALPYYNTWMYINLFGTIDASGRLYMTSADRFYAYNGQWQNRIVSGNFQTAGGAYGTWSVQWMSGKASIFATQKPDQNTFQDQYHPSPDKAIKPTYKVFDQVEWQ